MASILTSLTYFSNKLPANNLLYDFYKTRNPQKAREIKRQQTAMQERMEQVRFLNVTYDAGKQGEALNKLKALEDDVSRLKRSTSINPRRVAKEIDRLANKIGYLMNQYIQAGGGRPDLIPEGEAGHTAIELEGGYADDVTEVKAKPMERFTIDNPFGRLANSMYLDMRKVLNIQETRASLKRDNSATEAIKNARSVLGMLSDEFATIRSQRVTVDLTV